MTYGEALKYIHGISWTFCNPGLDRIRELCQRLGNPQKKLKFIHIAGTNGKGSTAAMLNSILTEAGYKVGLYTSPYIVDFNERIKLCGENISNGELAEITEYIKPFADAMADKPTEFELITAIAFEYFARQGADIVVLEAGMGGRLDSTNIIDSSLVSVITGIALDHTAFLGDTVEKIALEKAGIIKHGSPLIYGGRDIRAGEVIRCRAGEAGVPYSEVSHGDIKVKSSTLSGTVFDYKNHKDMKVTLLGAYQPENAALVLDVCEILRSRGISLSDDAIRQGLKKTVWHARFEIIKKEPLCIFDGAHNPQGIESAVGSIIGYFGDKKVCIVSGVLRDKDYDFIAGELSRVASCVYTITPDSDRALSAEKYAEVIKSHGTPAFPCPTVREALKAAKEQAEREESAVICLGSLYTYQEVIKEIKEI